jgi:hypothetical protein
MTDDYYRQADRDYKFKPEVQRYTFSIKLLLVEIYIIWNSKLTLICCYGSVSSLGKVKSKTIAVTDFGGP